MMDMEMMDMEMMDMEMMDMEMMDMEMMVCLLQFSPQGPLLSVAAQGHDSEISTSTFHQCRA